MPGAEPRPRRSTRNYYTDNPVPCDLPGHKTKLVVRSNTYKGRGYNEILMEDVAGAENLFTHAQKDMTTRS